MDLCQLPWIANPHPFHIVRHLFPAIPQVTGFWLLHLWDAFNREAMAYTRNVAALLTICCTIWYNMRSTNDFARSSQLQPRHFLVQSPPPKKDGKNPGKTLGIPGSEGYSTVAPHHPCIFFHPQLKIRWMDDLSHLWYLDMWSNHTICNSKGRSSVALRRRRCKRCWVVWNPSWGM